MEQEFRECRNEVGGESVAVSFCKSKKKKKAWDRYFSFSFPGLSRDEFAKTTKRTTAITATTMAPRYFISR